MVFGIAERASSCSSCVGNLPLKSIVLDQVLQLEGLCTAKELTAENVSRVLEEPGKFIYSSTEQVLEEWFLASLKDQQISRQQASPARLHMARNRGH